MKKQIQTIVLHWYKFNEWQDDVNVKYFPVEAEVCEYRYRLKNPPEYVGLRYIRKDIVKDALELPHSVTIIRLEPGMTQAVAQYTRYKRNKIKVLREQCDLYERHVQSAHEWLDNYRDERMLIDSEGDDMDAENDTLVL